jgi:hypothetical protein
MREVQAGPGAHDAGIDADEQQSQARTDQVGNGRRIGHVEIITVAVP